MATFRRGMPTPLIETESPSPLFMPEDRRSGASETAVDVDMREEIAPLSADEVEVKEDEIVAKENDDGSAVVEFEETEDDKRKSAALRAFDANLAETMPSSELSRIATMLLDSISRDKEARKRRDIQYAEGIKRTGLGNEAPGGAQFEGASRAVHTVLTEACIDFAARAMKELYPAKGPVKTQIIGKVSDVKLERAERKKTYMNWQLTRQISEYRPELEQLLTQLPLAGASYLKMWRDESKKRPTVEFLPIDDVYLPYACSDFYAATRLTHVQHITQITFEQRVASKLYRDMRISASSAGMSPEQSEASRATDKVEGKEEDAYNEDGLRDVFEVQVFLNLKELDTFVPKDMPYAPYIVSIDESTRNVLALYRNWGEKDELCQKLHHIVEFPLIPWRGAYPIGLGQAVGSLAGAATGALRALLDSAHIANFPAGLKLKGERMAGQTIQLQATGLTEIEGPVTIDDIRKLAMPLPFPGPSAVLFQLMEFCVNTAKGLINTADEKISDAGQNTPVGTTLALIEQGAITFSAVHARLHESQRRVLDILHRLDRDYLSNEEVVEELGELVVSRADFQGPMDVQPVSDPNIFSDTQRYAQQQAVLQIRQMFPQGFKDNVLLTRTLKLLNYPDYEEVLNLPAKPEEISPVEENLAARDPLRDIKVFDANDDFEHLRVHVAFLTSPLLCSNPLMANPALPRLIQHCADHVAAAYRKHATAAIKAAEAVGLHTASGLEQDAASTAGLRMAEETLAAEIGPLMEHLAQAAEQAKTLVPPPPKDVAIQVAELNAQAAQAREQAKVAGEVQRDQAKVAGEVQRDQAKAGIEVQKEQLIQQTEAQRINVEAQTEFARLQVESFLEERLVQLQQQFEATQKERDRAFTAQNAAIAEESERRAQEATMAIAALREESANVRAAEAAQHAEEMLLVKAEQDRITKLLEHKLQSESADADIEREVAKEMVIGKDDRQGS